MNGLLFLNSDDFEVQDGTKGKIMCNNIPGFSLILFFSPNCAHCGDILPIFKRLPGSISGCQFGIVNINNNKACVQMAKKTIAPITYVPYVVLYVDGRPFMVYKGPNDEEDIKQFVVEVAKNVQNRQRGRKEESKGNGIPAYTVGKPVCGDGKVCYLEFGDAYDN